MSKHESESGSIGGSIADFFHRLFAKDVSEKPEPLDSAARNVVPGQAGPNVINRRVTPVLNATNRALQRRIQKRKNK